MSLRYVTSAALVAGTVAAPGSSPLLQVPAGGEKVANHYLVTLDPIKLPNGKPNVEAQRDQIHSFLNRHGIKTSAAIHFPEISTVAVSVSEVRKLGEIRNDSAVGVVEEDAVVKASAVPAPREIANADLWGLDRIDQRTPIRDNSLALNGDGAGVDVYVVDSGVHVTHVQFEGRASNYWTAFPSYNATTLASGTNFNDGNGHGTHCAGTIGGKDYGVAPKTTIRAVRVLGDAGSGSTAGIVAGLTNVLRRADRSRRAVVSMSLGGLNINNAYFNIVDALVKDNVVVVAAAGNDNKQACSYQPAMVPSAITVGATDKTDTMSTFSNYGSCIDIFAPGTGILSSVPGPKNTETDVYSGTSMACPHVSGAVAVLLSQFPAIPSDKVVDVIKGSATKNVIKNIPSCPQSPNLLLHAKWSFANYKARAGSKQTDKWCQENKDNAGSWDDCEFKANNVCKAVAKTVTDKWCESVQCNEAYKGLCSMDS